MVIETKNIFKNFSVSELSKRNAIYSELLLLYICRKPKNKKQIEVELRRNFRKIQKSLPDFFIDFGASRDYIPSETKIINDELLRQDELGFLEVSFRNKEPFYKLTKRGKAIMEDAGWRNYTKELIYNLEISPINV